MLEKSHTLKYFMQRLYTNPAAQEVPWKVAERKYSEKFLAVDCEPADFVAYSN